MGLVAFDSSITAGMININDYDLIVIEQEMGVEVVSFYVALSTTK